MSILITNKKGNIEYVNPYFYKLTGYDESEVIGRNPRFLRYDDSMVEEHDEMWNNLVNTNSWSGVFKNKKKNGKLFWESANVSVVKNEKGDVTHYVAVKEDITEKVKIENELAKYQNNLEELVEEKTAQVTKQNIFFRTLIDTIPNPIFVQNSELKFTEINKSFEDFLQTTREQVLGKTIYDIILKAPAERASYYNEKLLLEHKSVVYESEFQNGW